MRTRYSPTSVNIFMAEFKGKYIHPFIKQISILYLRFIDNIMIMIWTKSEKDLKNVMKELKIKRPSMKSNYFLGTLVCIDQHEKL